MAQLFIQNAFLAPALYAIQNDLLNFYDFRLFQNSVTVSRNTVIGDLTEANFTGYAPIAPTWSTPVYDGSQYANTVSQPLVWIWTSGSSQVIYGAYIYDSPNTRLVACFNFAAPVTVDAGTPIVAAQFTVRLKSEF